MKTEIAKKSSNYYSKRMSQASKRNIKRYMWAYALIAPTVLIICIMNLWPIIQTIYYSFNDVTGFMTPKLVGLKNYTTALSDNELVQALINTTVYTVVTVPLGVAISLIVAVFLNAKIKGKSLFRVLYFLPVISAPVAVAMVWRWLYNSKYGLINYFLSIFGINGPDWIGDSHYALISIMIVGIWSMVGYNMVILLAGLQDIPKTFYEAAEIDGAGSFRKFLNITIPFVSPTLFFVVITTMISSFQVFDYIYMMIDKTNPALKSAQSVVYLFYKYTFVLYDKGYGATIAVILLAIILLITFIQMKLQNKWVHYQ